MNSVGSRGRSVVALSVLGLATGGLLWAGPRPRDVPHTGPALVDWLTRTPVGQSIATLAGLAAELCLLWLCLGAALVCLGRLPGLVGRLSDAIAARVTPLVVRRAVEAALGAVVATGSTAVTAAPAVAAAPVAAVAPAVAAAPMAAVAPAVAAAPTGTAATSRYVSTAGATDPPAVDMIWARGGTTPPVPPLPFLDRPASPSATPSPRFPHPVLVPSSPVPDHAVVVRRGDSLWAIAGRHLGPTATDAQIAAAWPRWYATNRAVIGPDPDLLLPGQRLMPPVDSSTAAADRSPR